MSGKECEIGAPSRAVRESPTLESFDCGRRRRIAEASFGIYRNVKSKPLWVKMDDCVSIK